MTPKAISHIQSELKIGQHPNMKEISIEELMAQHMKDEQHRSFPSIISLAEWGRFQVEFETSQVNFMENMNQPPQEELIFENEVDKLVISMAELAKSRAELVTCQAKFLEETKAKVQFHSIPLKSSNKK